MKNIIFLILTFVLSTCSIHKEDYSNNISCVTPKLIFQDKESCEKSNKHLCVYHNWIWYQDGWVCDSANTINNNIINE